LALPEIFNTIEQSAISVWIRDTDSLFGFYFILLFHTIGLALLVGGIPSSICAFLVLRRIFR